MPFVMATVSSNGEELKCEFIAVLALCQMCTMLFTARRKERALPHLRCCLVDIAVGYFEATLIDFFGHLGTVKQAVNTTLT